MRAVSFEAACHFLTKLRLPVSHDCDSVGVLVSRASEVGAEMPQYRVEDALMLTVPPSPFVVVVVVDRGARLP